jgi:hypothetical protein
MLITLLFLWVFFLPFDLSALFTIHCDCSDLVPYGSNCGSTVGFGRFSKLVSSMFSFPPHIYGVMVGLILGDASLQFASKAHKNARLSLTQSLAHFSYLWHVFTILSHYCSNSPIFRSGVVKGYRFFGVYFQTRALPCFTELYSLFYVNGVKIVPEDIFNLLTPAALAHWICCDGSVQRHGLILCTDSYTIQDVNRLLNVLILKFQLDCILREHRPNQWRIYIRQGSMITLRNIVLPYMEPSML